MVRWTELAGGHGARVARELAKLGLKYFDGDDDVGDGPDVSTQLGDNLLGWPCWIHAGAPGKCPRCDEPMRLLFQIDSEDNVPWSWGDAGTAWLLQCRKHLDVLSFDWECH